LGTGSEGSGGDGGGGGNLAAQTAACEQRLLGEMRRLLTATNLPPASRVVVLQAAARLHDVSVCQPSSTVHEMAAGSAAGAASESHAEATPQLATTSPLLLVVECLGMEEPEIRAAAGAALDALCDARDTTLDALLLHSSASDVVLQHLGRALDERAVLLYELSHKLGTELV
jgi:hypothetical protein